jgi:transcriptional regulator with PAS, ATPase and Fis domain
MRHNIGDIIGGTKKMLRVYDLIAKIAPTTTTVLILGETGTGKELVARAIHQLSKRAYQSFVKIDCTALPETLLESELFGYKKGAFTDARFDKPGKFELADKGTIFLDEIGELPVTIQAKLLRFLEDSVFEPLGGLASVRVDVRIITATNRDLQSAILQGRFRKDLYYRLNVFPIRLPDLQERLDDIPLLVEHFITRYNEQLDKNIHGIDKEVRHLFQTFTWPGNVRQLRHVLEYACINCPGNRIKIEHLPDEIRIQGVEQRGSLYRGSALEESEKKVLADCLRKNNYKRNATANELHISRITLWRKMKKYGLI